MNAQIDYLRRIADALDGQNTDPTEYNEAQIGYLKRIAEAVENGGGGSGGGAVALRLTYDEQTQTVKMGKTYNELLALCKNGAYVFFCMPNDTPSIEEANSFICYSLSGLYAADEYNPYEAIFFTGDSAYARMQFTATSADEEMTMVNS